MVSMREFSPAFTIEDARAAGLMKDQVYFLLKREKIEFMGWGGYVRPEALQPEFMALAVATALREDVTLCLMRALVHRDLRDAIPFASDMGLPRGAHQPAGFSNVSWYSFDPATFSIGCEYADTGGS